MNSVIVTVLLIALFVASIFVSIRFINECERAKRNEDKVIACLKVAISVSIALIFLISALIYK